MENREGTKRNVGAFQMELLRHLTISFNNYYLKYAAIEYDFRFFFTYETYVNQTHASKKCCSTDTIINRLLSKGERLIILIAITPQGLLYKREKTGHPNSDL